MRRPLNKAIKWLGSFPSDTLTCNALPSNKLLSISIVFKAAVPCSSREEFRPFITEILFGNLFKNFNKK